MLSSHIQSMPAATTNAASTPAIAATSGRSCPRRPHAGDRGHEAGADRDHEQQQADHSQLGERLEPQRVGVAHEQRQRGMLHPPGLVRARAAAEHRLGLPLVDRRGPQLPPAAAGRADQVRAGEVALDQPHVGAGRLLEGLELVHRVVRGHAHREHRDRPERDPRLGRQGQLQARAPSRRTGTRPSTAPRRKGRAGPSTAPRSRPRWRPAPSPAGRSRARRGPACP